jgi:hypothetical protein
MHVLEGMRQGGAESLILEHVRHAGPGVQVIVCALNDGGPALEGARALGADTFVLGKGGARLAGLSRLADLMRRERADVVNGHNPTGALYAVVAARMAGVRVAFRTEHSLHYPGRHSGYYPLLEPLLTPFTRRRGYLFQAVLESHVSRLRWAARRLVTMANGIERAPHPRTRKAVRKTPAVRSERAHRAHGRKLDAPEGAGRPCSRRSRPRPRACLRARLWIAARRSAARFTPKRTRARARHRRSRALAGRTLRRR